jgi:hypothetical protein
MAKTAIVILVLFSALALAHAAHADFKGGEELYELCTRPDDVRAHSFCVGYVAAIGDVLGDGVVSGWRACLPSKATQGEVARIAIQWMKAHPENRGFGASDVAAQALAHSYPCAK